MAQPHRICILGGGFGGLYTALKLDQFPWSSTQKPQITLVDQQERFVFLPFLYELVTNEMDEWEIAPTFESLLAKTAINFVQAKVTAIDPVTQDVTLDNGQILNSDRLVLGLGGETPLTIVPGAQDYAIPFRTLKDVHRLKQRLQILEHREQRLIRIAVVGAGPSGVELSCKLADRLGDRGEIHLIDRNPAILKTADPFNQSAAQRALQQRQVILHLDSAVAEVNASSITLANQSSTESNAALLADIVLWTVGNTMPDVIQSLDLPKNEQGQILINATLQVQSHEKLYALGDLAAINDPDIDIPKTAQAAFQQATYAAWNIWASLTGRALLPFRYSHLGEMLTLGTEEAALAGLGLTLEGPLATVARRGIYLCRFPTLEHQVSVGLQWILKPFQGAKS